LFHITLEFSNDLHPEAFHQFLEHFLRDVTLVGKYFAKKVLYQIGYGFAMPKARFAPEIWEKLRELGNSAEKAIEILVHKNLD
jgi:hypothetical protein